MANFTMYLYEVLDAPFEGKTVDDVVRAELTNFPQLPAISEGSFNMSFYDLFKRRNLYKEIGFETISGWVHEFLSIVDRARILYVDKVNLQLSNLDTLLSRVVEEVDVHTNTSYLNPTNGAAQPQLEDMKVNAASKVENRNQRIAGLFKSNPEVMEEMTNMTMIYEDMLMFFDRCFMGVI